MTTDGGHAQQPSVENQPTHAPRPSATEHGGSLGGVPQPGDVPSDAARDSIFTASANPAGATSTACPDLLAPALPALYRHIDGTCLPSLDNVYAALTLQWVWTCAVARQFDWPQTSERTRHAGRQMLTQARTLRPTADAPQAFRREFAEEQQVALNSLERGFNVDFARLFDSMADVGRLPFFSNTPDAADRLGWMVYEPVLRRRLEDAFGLDPANPLMPALLNLRNTNYAQRMMDGLREVSRQQQADTPLSADSMKRLHGAGVAADDSAMFGEPLSFSVPGGRNMTVDGIFAAWNSLQDFNRRIAALSGKPGIDPWQMTIDNRIVTAMQGDHYTDWRQHPLDTLHDVRISRGALQPEVGAAFIEGLIADHRRALSGVDPQNANDLKTLIARLSQQLLLAHPFADGNGRVTTVLTPQVLLGKLQALRIGPLSLHRPHMFDDIWIALLTPEQAATTLRPLDDYPAVPAVAQRAVHQ
ncbi:hypothetical protein BH10PSE18_BH10PSE18_48600 [soil metagenome]